VVDELILIGFLRHEAAADGAAAIVDQVIARALNCLLGGASAAEACAQGRRLLESYSRHPVRGYESRSSLARAS